MRFAIGIEYDGATYCGWQKQTNRQGIQNQLEKVLSEFANHSISVTVAGRTDTGVHATYQVAHFDTCVVRPHYAWVRAINAKLPQDIRILWIQLVPELFHARFSALTRTYHYILYNAPIRPALLSRKVGWYHQPLKIDKMKQACQYLLGEHDFSSFRASECQSLSPVRTLYQLNLQKNHDYFIFKFEANAFLQHMIRNIVGTLVYVGASKQPPEWVEQLLAQKDRRFAAPTFGASGLYLTEIRYDPKLVVLPVPKNFLIF